MSDTWLIEHLRSPQIIGGVLEVWSRLPDEDRKALRALRPTIVEMDLRSRTGQCGLYTYDEDDELAITRRWIVIDDSLDYQQAAAVAAHELAHCVLRHDQAIPGKLGRDNLALFIETQAEYLASRWGFAGVKGSTGRSRRTWRS